MAITCLHGKHRAVSTKQLLEQRTSENIVGAAPVVAGLALFILPGRAAR